MSKSRSFMIVLVLLQSCILSFEARACSSCGNGSSNPLYLYPNEEAKVYFGVSHQSNFEDVTYDGDTSSSFVLKRRISYVGAVGARINQRSFVALSAPVINHTGVSGAERTVLGDPQFNIRYAVQQQIFTRPSLPQIELIGGLKLSKSRNVQQSRDPEMLDVGGTGYNEASVGVDLWSGMTPIQFGGSFHHIFSQPQREWQGKLHPGDRQVLSLSIGKAWSLLKISLGPVFNRRFTKTKSSQTIAESDSQSQNFFATVDVKGDDRWVIRGAFVRQAAFGFNRSTSRSNSITLAMMRTL